MKLGIPRALAYYRYGVLWRTFFDQLHIPYLLSPPTNKEILAAGTKRAVDETCLPYKLFLGHVNALLAQTDTIFVPCLQKTGREDEFCLRFWGLPDTVQASFANVNIHSYVQKGGMHQLQGFLALGRTFGKSNTESLIAYRKALNAQAKADQAKFQIEREKLASRKPKILLAAQSYLYHDPFLGGEIRRIIEQLGGTALSIDAWSKHYTRPKAQHLSSDIYWTTNREILGAIEVARAQVDGIILLTAFPCGSDCLANELVLRRVQNLPLIQILLDEHQAQEGLITRLESFMDMIHAPNTKVV